MVHARHVSHVPHIPHVSHVPHVRMRRFTPLPGRRLPPQVAQEPPRVTKAPPAPIAVVEERTREEIVAVVFARALRSGDRQLVASMIRSIAAGGYDLDAVSAHAVRQVPSQASLFSSAASVGIGPEGVAEPEVAPEVERPPAGEAVAPEVVPVPASPATPTAPVVQREAVVSDGGGDLKSMRALRAAQDPNALVQIYDQKIQQLVRRYISRSADFDDVLQDVRLFLIERHGDLRVADARNLHAVITTWVMWQVRAITKKYRTRDRLQPVSACSLESADDAAPLLERSALSDGRWGSMARTEAAVDVRMMFDGSDSTTQRALAVRMLGLTRAESGIDTKRGRKRLTQTLERDALVLAG